MRDEIFTQNICTISSRNKRISRISSQRSPWRTQSKSRISGANYWTLRTFDTTTRRVLIRPALWDTSGPRAIWTVSQRRPIGRVRAKTASVARPRGTFSASTTPSSSRTRIILPWSTSSHGQMTIPRLRPYQRIMARIEKRWDMKSDSGTFEL